MILTPKNWKSFQHYKDRSPAWIKLHKGLLENYDFHCLPLASKALAPMLWLLASEYDDGRINSSLEALAFRLHMTKGELADALAPLIEKEFFDASDPLAETERSASLEEDTNTREEDKKEKEPSSASRPRNDDFETLKRIYPRRKGNYGWKAAERKFNALAKTGVDPKVIIAAAEKLCITLRAKIGTEYIPMPASWLNSEDFLEAAVATFEPIVPDKIPIEKAVELYAQSGIWSRHAPVPDISRAPADLLAKFGLMPDGRKLEGARP